jgi:hypothetical protein
MLNLKKGPVCQSQNENSKNFQDILPIGKGIQKLEENMEKQAYFS